LQVQLQYRRHFALLASIAALLGISAAWRVQAGMEVAFASYGALHACSVAASLRSRVALWRRLAFVVAAAVISVSATQVGLEVYWLVPRSPAVASQFAIGLASIVGAFAYALLLRSVLGFRLAAVALVWVPVICTLAALAAFTVGGLALMGVWVAASWWLAFSGSLWYADHNGLKSNPPNQEEALQ
jgi:hypothetical protein